MADRDVPDRSGTNLAEVEFVDPDEFCMLLISNRLLLRSDDVERGIRGLVDPSDGKRYVVAESALQESLKQEGSS